MIRMHGTALLTFTKYRNLGSLETVMTFDRACLALRGLNDWYMKTQVYEEITFNIMVTISKRGKPKDEKIGSGRIELIPGSIQ